MAKKNIRIYIKLKNNVLIFIKKIRIFNISTNSGTFCFHSNGIFFNFFISMYQDNVTRTHQITFYSLTIMHDDYY